MEPTSDTRGGNFDVSGIENMGDDDKVVWRFRMLGMQKRFLAGWSDRTWGETETLLVLRGFSFIVCLASVG